jgi:hypothetical protein
LKNLNSHLPKVFIVNFHWRSVLQLFTNFISFKVEVQGGGAMKYEDLLHHEELTVTKDELKRYRQYGLITTQRTSEGYAAGVNAELPEITVHAIKEIHKQRTSPHIKNTQEIIFILFSKGYPVRLENLKKKIKEFLVERIMSDLTTSNQEMEYDPNFYDEMKDYLNKTRLVRPVGRPSNEREKALENEVKREMHRFRSSQPFIEYFLGISSNGLAVLGRLSDEFGLEFNNVPDWLDHQFWLDLIDHSTDSDFDQILHVWKLINHYVKMLEEHQEQLPRAKAAVDFLREQKWLERTEIIKLLIFAMLKPDWRSQAIEFLERKEAKQIWLKQWE